MGKMKLGSGISSSMLTSPVPSQAVEQLEQPTFTVNEVEEVIEKPVFSVVEVLHAIPKPHFQIQQVVETVQKPEFSIESEVHVVKKPVFVVSEEQNAIPAFFRSKERMVLWAVFAVQIIQSILMMRQGH